jgi:hypothetical protein
MRAKPMWHHKSVIVAFQIALRLLTDLFALTAVGFRGRRATAAELLSTKSGESSRGELTG